MSSYRVEVYVDDKRRKRGIPSMAWLSDVIEEALRRDFRLNAEDYTVEVHGPPELHFVMSEHRL